MLINIENKGKIIEQQAEVFKTSSDDEFIPMSCQNTIKLKALKSNVNCKDIASAIRAICLTILHKVARGNLAIEDVIEIANFNVAETIKHVRKHVEGKIRPGVTKNGFGPVHAMSIFENVAASKESTETLKTLFVIATMQPYMQIVGLENYVVNVYEDELELDDSNLNNVIQATQILNCLLVCVDMCIEKQRTVDKNAYFALEEWLIFIRTLKNVVTVEADKAALFIDAIDTVSVILFAYKVGIINKTLLLYEETLNSSEAKALMECFQVMDRGYLNIVALPTILGVNTPLDRMRFNLQVVFNALNSSDFIENTPFKLKHGQLLVYTDANLKGHVRGSAIVAVDFLEEPIQVMKKMEASKSYYSYSTEGFATIGKHITDVANAITLLNCKSMVEDLSKIKYYALNNHFSNLECSTMRKLLFSLNPHSVLLYLPVSVRDASSDLILSEELTKIKFVYKLNSSKDFLEYDNATGFKALGSVMLEHPYLVLLKTLNPNLVRETVYNGERDKFTFKTFSYDMCLLQEVDSFSFNNKDEKILIHETEGEHSIHFEYSVRELMRLSAAGTYNLDVQEYSDRVTRLIGVKDKLEMLFEESYTALYNSVDREKEFEDERKFERAKQIITNNVILHDMARRVRRAVLQNFIDDTGALDENITMAALNKMMNQALINVMEQVGANLLGSVIVIDDAIKRAKEISREYLGGNYENFN